MVIGRVRVSRTSPLSGDGAGVAAAVSCRHFRPSREVLRCHIGVATAMYSRGQLSDLRVRQYVGRVIICARLAEHGHDGHRIGETEFHMVRTGRMDFGRARLAYYRDTFHWHPDIDSLPIFLAQAL